MKVVPTINIAQSETAHTEFMELYETLRSKSDLLHFDFGDGTMSEMITIQPEQLHVDVSSDSVWHVMSLNIAHYVEIAAVHMPSLLIVHAEADDFSQEIINRLVEYGLKVGVSILPETDMKVLSGLKGVSEVLIFGGHLGYNGGSAQLELLSRVGDVHGLQPGAETSWDGGANAETVPAMKTAGLDTAYVGSAISGSNDPIESMQKLQKIAAI